MNRNDSSASPHGAVRRAGARARSHALLAATLACSTLFAASLAAIAVTPAGASAPARIARTQKLQLRHTSAGSILVDSAGFTLYRFSKDTGAKNTCIANRECAVTWTALTSSARPTAGTGVKASLISTIALPGGQRQVTYAGHPLYLYEPASERGETSYMGVRQFGGTWYGVNSSGAQVR